MKSRPGWLLSMTPLFAAILTICIPACDRSTEAKLPAKVVAEGDVRWVDPKTLQPGPIQRNKLSDEQMARIREIRSTFAEVDSSTMEKWVDDFKRDANPDRELEVWERMSKAYKSYCTGRTLSLIAKKDVFGVVLLRSSASEQDVLKHVQLKELSRDDAVEVMKGF